MPVHICIILQETHNHKRPKKATGVERGKWICNVSVRHSRSLRVAIDRTPCGAAVLWICRAGGQHENVTLDVVTCQSNGEILIDLDIRVDARNLFTTHAVVQLGGGHRQQVA